ncbi:probable calcium-binding protein CML49 [Abrus precatorius]|uniref:Probable calcium-binding protein CML49 n=1 Tax=Abrus precatorius TaxID=3816 RepID=A0A8B8M8N1_ABRPR|nr:probable calcium-binding protein CML49 [Abrus precatorius]
MSGYPHQPPGYGYGYGAPPPSQSYGGPPPSQSYGGPPPAQPYSAYGQPSAPYAAPYNKPPKDESHSHGGSSGGYPPPVSGYGSPFASLVPSAFPPGTDPNVIACFQMADQDGSGFIDDKEMQRALSSYNQSFSLRTVHLLMYHFTNTNVKKIGPKEFTTLFYSLQNWRSIFERFDKDRSGKIDSTELRDALLSLGYAVSPVVLDLLVSKFDKTGGKSRAIEYDNFIECCLTVKGLTDKFKEKDTGYTGSATFTYESFMLTVLPFLIA